MGHSFSGCIVDTEVFVRSDLAHRFWPFDGPRHICLETLREEWVILYLCLLRSAKCLSFSVCPCVFGLSCVPRNISRFLWLHSCIRFLLSNEAVWLDAHGYEPRKWKSLHLLNPCGGRLWFVSLLLSLFCAFVCLCLIVRVFLRSPLDAPIRHARSLPLL